MEKKTPQKFESLKDAKFRTLENEDLEAVSGGVMANTITTGSATWPNTTDDGADN